MKYLWFGFSTIKLICHKKKKNSSETFVDVVRRIELTLANSVFCGTQQGQQK